MIQSTVGILGVLSQQGKGKQMVILFSVVAASALGAFYWYMVISREQKWLQKTGRDQLSPKMVGLKVFAIMAFTVIYLVVTTAGDALTVDWEKATAAVFAPAVFTMFIAMPTIHCIFGKEGAKIDEKLQSSDPDSLEKARAIDITRNTFRVMFFLWAIILLVRILF